MSGYQPGPYVPPPAGRAGYWRPGPQGPPLYVPLPGPMKPPTPPAKAALLATVWTTVAVGLSAALVYLAGIVVTLFGYLMIAAWAAPQRALDEQNRKGVAATNALFTDRMSLWMASLVLGIVVANVAAVLQAKRATGRLTRTPPQSSIGPVVVGFLCGWGAALLIVVVILGQWFQAQAT